MKNIINHIAYFASFFTIVIFFAGCEKNESKENDTEVYSEYVENYVPYYISPETMEQNSYWNFGSEPSIVLVISGSRISKTNSSTKAIYDSLASKYGDLNYKRNAEIERDGALSVAIDSIIIVSDCDIDSEHPKGSNLSDIVKLSTKGYYEYINGGYKQIDLGKDKLISEYKKYELSLLCHKHGLGFHFDKTLSIKGTHNFTITVVFENGKSLTSTQTVDFD